MTSLSKNVYADKLDDIVNKYNNTYHRIIKIKPVDVKSNTYVNFSKEINNEDPNLKFVIPLQYVPNWPEKCFVIIKVKGKEIVVAFYEKELRKSNQKQFRVEKAIKRKGNKLYVTWTGYDSSLNSCIDEKDIV